MNAILKQANRSILLGDKVHDLLETDWQNLDHKSGVDFGGALEFCLGRLGAKARGILRSRLSYMLKPVENQRGDS